ncbi:protein CFAP20DC isoform X2 [Cynoglossus semilaevis]|uniref:protein CFAP20DC isoform X2 n=1 Tax=Cynoglossus semilaevis TaxID=244447 RepID=UPI000D62B981|nr:uncharacterized protein C3orf67 homolog isoform X2 [Cynoglossus semilaevis]
MFSRNYQGGAVVEIFSAQGKDPVAQWKLSGGPSAIQKEYNKEVKGFVYCLKGSSQTVKMQMPENRKMSLGLHQRFLVLQVNIPQTKDFSLELVITDLEHLKRRLHLSTVHKELTATLLHARVPFVGLKRECWSTLCIDLVSISTGLFKGFSSLDGITVFASCEIRRIFTMKTGPLVTDEVVFLSGPGFMDEIPRSCQFPAGLIHVTQVLNMKNLQKTDVRIVHKSSERVPDQSNAATSSSNHRVRTPSVLHTASGFKPSAAAPPQPGRKSSLASGRMTRSVLQISDMASVSERSQGVPAEVQSIGCQSESVSPEDHTGTPGRTQPHPPADRQKSKKPVVLRAGADGLTSPDAASGRYRNRSKNEEKVPSCSEEEIKQRPLTLIDKTEHLKADDFSLSPTKDIFRLTTPTSEPPSCPPRAALPRDLQAWSSWESNEGSEPQLTLQEEVFSFSSQPHSPKRGQGQGDQEKMEKGLDQAQSGSGQRHEARPEDDFIGSESDEEKNSSPSTPRSPGPGLNLLKSPSPHKTLPGELSSGVSDRHIKSSSSGGPGLAVAPSRCLSPGVRSSRQESKHGRSGPGRGAKQVQNGSSRAAPSRSLRQEVEPDDASLHQEEDEPPKPVDSSHNDLHLLGSLRLQGDEKEEEEEEEEEELQMLASLKREQEEDECRAPGLSESQIRQCNVSVSISSDDTTTWTQQVNQGHNYQSEMNPLQHSNPREWMDVLSPPIMPARQPGRSGNTPNDWGNLGGGGDGRVKEEEPEEEEYLNLLYDACLNCYFDPKTGKYYELA